MVTFNSNNILHRFNSYHNFEEIDSLDEILVDFVGGFEGLEIELKVFQSVPEFGVIKRHQIGQGHITFQVTHHRGDGVFLRGISLVET